MMVDQIIQQGINENNNACHLKTFLDRREHGKLKTSLSAVRCGVVAFQNLYTDRPAHKNSCGCEELHLSTCGESKKELEILECNHYDHSHTKQDPPIVKDASFTMTWHPRHFIQHFMEADGFVNRHEEQNECEHSPVITIGILRGFLEYSDEP